MQDAGIHTCCPFAVTDFVIFAFRKHRDGKDSRNLVPMENNMAFTAVDIAQKILVRRIWALPLINTVLSQLSLCIQDDFPNSGQVVL